MGGIAALLGIFLLSLFAFWRFGRTLGSLALFLLTLTFLPSQTLVTLAEPTSSLQTTAPTGWVLSASGAVLVFTTFAIPRSRLVRCVPFALWLLPLAIIVISAFSVGFEAQIVSGIQQWFFSALAWGIGGALAIGIRKSEVKERQLAVLLTGLIILQAIGVLLQVAGIRDLSHLEIIDGESVSRYKGWAYHPADLGKILILYMVLLLPMTQSEDRWTRRYAFGSAILSLALIGVTASRANLAAIVLAFILWYAFMARGNAIARFGPLIAGSVVIGFALGPALLRQASDREGGSRPQLLATAWAQVEQNLWLGLGTNNYLPVVSQYDLKAANGLPVHNSFVLLLAELGVIAVTILAFVFIVLLIRVMRGMRGDASTRLVARSALVFLPGVFFVLFTGHGMLSERILPLFMLICGYLYQALDQGTSSSAVETGRFAQRGRELKKPSDSPPSSASLRRTPLTLETYETTSEKTASGDGDSRGPGPVDPFYR